MLALIPQVVLLLLVTMGAHNMWRSPLRAEAGMTKKNVHVRFFRANRASRNGDGWTWPDDGAVGDWLLGRLTELEQEDVSERIVDWYGNSYLVEAQHNNGPHQFSVSSVRSDRLPLVLRAGEASGGPLDIGDRDRLLEPTYLTFFPNRIVALVRSGATPGHRAAASAIAKLVKLDLELLPIPRTDVLLMIQRGQAVSTLDIGFAAGSIDAATETDDVIKGAANLQKLVPASDHVRFTLTAETTDHRRSLRTRVLNLVTRRGLDGLDVARVRLLDEDAGSELVDLIETDIATTVPIEVDGKMRHFMPHDARAAAELAFAQLSVVLSHAIALAVDGDDS